MRRCAKRRTRGRMVGDLGSDDWVGGWLWTETMLTPTHISCRVTQKQRTFSRVSRWGKSWIESEWRRVDWSLTVASES